MAWPLVVWPTLSGLVAAGGLAQETTLSWSTAGAYGWTVPDTAHALAFEVAGAQGGSSSGQGSASGGRGVYVFTLLFLNSGQALTTLSGDRAGEGALAARTAAAG